MLLLLLHVLLVLAVGQQGLFDAFKNCGPCVACETKGSNVYVTLPAIGDGIGTKILDVVKMISYTQFRGWNFGGVVSQNYAHRVNTSIFYDFFFGDGRAILSRFALSGLNPIATYHASTKLDLDNLNFENGESKSGPIFVHYALTTLAVPQQIFLNHTLWKLLRKTVNCGMQSASNYLSSIKEFHDIQPSTLRVVAHIRLGDLLNDKLRNMLPIKYFAKLCDTISIIYPQTRFHIISSLLMPNSSVEREIHKQFSRFPNLDIHIDYESFDTVNGDVMRDIAQMIDADVLIISKSSFSYVPAVYNSNCIVYSPFWLGPRDDWISTANDSFEERLVQCIQRVKGRYSLI